MDRLDLAVRQDFRQQLSPDRRALRLQAGKVTEAAEAIFVILSFCVFMGVLTPIVAPDQILTDEDRDQIRLLFTPIYVAIALLMVRHRSAIAAVVKDNWCIFLLILLSFVSILWSVDPGVTARRAAALLFTTLFPVYLADRYPLVATIELLAIAAGVIIALSYAFVLFLPGLGINPEDMTWRGIFYHKNTLAPCVLIGILALAWLPRTSRLRRRLVWIGIALAAVMLWFSGSRTALVTLVFITALDLLLLPLRRGGLRGVTGMLTVLAVLYVLVVAGFAESSALLDLLGKDTTLTGRTELWPLVEQAIRDRPWLGYGYGAFWGSPYSPRTAIWELVGWEAPSAHNGYLELALAFGIPALLLFLSLLLSNLKKAVRLMRRGDKLAASWGFSTTLMVAIAAADESVLLEQNSIYWVLLTAASIYLSRHAAGRNDAHAAVSIGAENWR